MSAHAGRRGSTRPLRVLESFRAPRVTTNPYLTLLLRSLPDDVEARTFSWPAALLGRYDVLHVHWPEVVVDRRHPARRLAALSLFGLVLLRCRVTGCAIVRTAHNVRPHERPGAPTRAVLRLCDRWTTWWVRLNDMTPTPPDAPATTVLHGHLRGWFEGAPRGERVPGRLLYFGLVRRYKGVDELLDAFARAADEKLTLRVVGRPADAEVAAAVRAAVAQDGRVSVVLDHVPDDVLAREIAECELVVLPYRDMHNSSAVLLALSLGRPVLVPANAVTEALADEVGQGWVLRYEAPLEPAVLLAALDQTRSLDAGKPDLTNREWAAIGREHADVFLMASRLAKSRRPRSRRDAELA